VAGSNNLETKGTIENENFLVVLETRGSPHEG
jgi:hypothetical protein